MACEETGGVLKHLDILKILARCPAVLRNPERYFLLISHMRANTSLFGHIMGSHPSVSGYYEQHIGYYSRRSLFRSRLLFHSRNPDARVTPVYFDKVLHNYHEISPGVLARPDVQGIFALRAPESAIPSIMALYERVDPGHEWASAQGAAKYYQERLIQMKALWLKVPPNNARLYLDAEVLVKNTEDALTALSQNLALVPRLKSEYDTFALTGKRGYGDSSDIINKGRVVPFGNTYSETQVPTSILGEARDTYLQVRSTLAKEADPRLLDNT